MEFFTIFTDVTDDRFFRLFFKAFAVLFAVSYLVYAIVVTRQTQVMNKTFTTKSSPLLFAVSMMQVFLAVLLILIALFFA